MNERIMQPMQSVISLRHISKRFGATLALNRIDFSAEAGEIIGLIGPNGAGKSTMMGILTGVVPATDGSFVISGKEYSPAQYNTAIARENGIACAYQEFSLCANLSVYENFALTILPHTILEKPGWRKRVRQVAKQTLDEVFPNNDINVNTKLFHLSIERRQMVEICCAVATNGLKTLILDEPTSSLTNDRIDQLHHAIAKLQAKGITVIYISHKLEEIIRVSSRVVVMRNGEKTWEGATSTITAERLVDLMGGHLVHRIENAQPHRADAPTLVSIEHLSTEALHDVSLQVYAGEIIGISGLGGSGQRELLHEIYRAGMGKASKGVSLNASVSFVSGDRQNEGIFNLWSIADNIIISSLDQLVNWRLLNKKKADDLAQSWYDKLKFKAEGRESPIVSLSGGNQQKAIIGRGIASGSDLILFDDPTRGVDIETKLEIYRILAELRQEGKSVIWYSTEDNEMLECDRVYVMQDGTIASEIVGSEISVDSIVAASFQESSSKQEKTAEKAKASLGKSLLHFLSKGATVSGLVFACIWLIVCSLNQNANTRTGLTYLIGSAVPLVFVSIAQMFIVLAGDINMGIGNAMGLVNVLSATIYVQNPTLGIVSFLLFLIIYTVVAVLIHKRRMPSIVVSLGMSTIWLGISLIILPTPGGSSIEWLNDFLKLKTPLLPIQLYICILTAALTYWILARSKYGMVLRGIGSSPTAVTRRGWSYLTAHVTLYALSAVFVLLAGIALTGISKGADPNGSTSYQMMSIAVILLGGCSFSGGIVEPVGVVFAALSISLISSMLTFMQVSSNYRTAVIGVILLLALAGGDLLKRRDKQ